MAQSVLPRSVQRLIDEFARLPGIGPKSASRLTFYLLRAADNQAGDLATALQELKERTRLCSVCFNITEDDPCPICDDEARDARLLCVVEEPLDVLAIERSRAYSGRYHVLHGAISPLDGVGPEELRIRPLLARATEAREVIVATDPDVEGDATALYLARVLKPLGVRVSRLAHGVAVGTEIEYADRVSLMRALENRRDL